MRWTAILVLLLVVTSPPSRAHAESAVPHDTASCFYTSSTHTMPAAGEVPANWPVFRIALAPFGVDAESTVLVRRSDGVRVPAVVDTRSPGIALLPLEDLVVGETYDLLHPECRYEPTETTEYRAVAPLPTATSLGTIALSGLRATYRSRGRENLVYQAEVELTPDPSIEPWVGAYRWGPQSGGEVQAFTQLTELRTSFFVDCNTGAWRGLGVAPGEVVVRGAAGPIVSRLVVFTPEVSEIYRCEDALIVHPDTGEPLTPDEIAYWDRREMDGGAGGLDGGTTPAVDGGRMGMHTEPDTHGSCSIARADASTSPLLAVLGVMLVVSTRRRLRDSRRS